MRKPFLFCLLGVLLAGSVSGKHMYLIEEPAEPALEGTLLPHPYAAEKIAHEVVGNVTGLSDFGTSLPPELIQAGFDCPGFAKKGDLIWEWREIEFIYRSRREEDKIPWKLRREDGIIVEVFGNWGWFGLSFLVWVHPESAHVWGWWGTKGPPRDIEHRFSSAYPWKRVETKGLLRNPETGETNIPGMEVKYVNRDGDGYLTLWWDCGEGDGEEAEKQERFWDWKDEMPEELDDAAVGTRELAEQQARRLAAKRGAGIEPDMRCEAKLFRVSRAVPGFCEYGDGVWDIRFVRPAEGNAPPGCRMVFLELLIRTVTGETFCVVGPPEQMGVWSGE